MGKTRRWLRHVLLGRPEGLRSRLARRLRARWGVAASPPAQPTEAGTSATADEGPAPSGWIAVLGAAEVAEGRLVEVVAAGRAVAIARSGGELSAFTATCPHAGGPLADGWIEGGVLTCPLHGWTFDLATGGCQVDPELPLERWGVRLAGERVEVLPPGSHGP